MSASDATELYQIHVLAAVRCAKSDNYLGACTENSLAGRAACEAGDYEKAYDRYENSLAFAHKVMGTNSSPDIRHHMMVQIAFSHVNAGKCALRRSLAVGEKPSEENEGVWWERSVMHFINASHSIKRVTASDAGVAKLRSLFADKVKETGDPHLEKFLSLDPPYHVPARPKERLRPSRT